MPGFFGPFRPDPFRFRPPRIRRWLYWLFKCQNAYVLRRTFKLSHLHLSEQGLNRLKQIRPGASTIVASNHVCYMDPPVLFDLSLKAGVRLTGMAGIEPFDVARGILGWFLQSAGAFSVDRGVLDRNALETAQGILDDGRYPLLVHPEGEAGYTNKVLQPFQPGAALLALNSAERLKGTGQPVHIVPIGLRYAFASNPDTILKSAIQDMYAMLHRPPAAAEDLPLWLQVIALCQEGIGSLERAYPQYVPPRDASLSQRIEALRDFLLRALVDEHDPRAQRENLSWDALMLLKNRLRSLIYRKYHAPPLDSVNAALHRMENLLEPQPPALLRRREAQWIGRVFEREPFGKRQRRLLEHVRQQVPYALMRQSASGEDLARWGRQLNETRQIKLLTLLRDDIDRQDDSPEGVDETLVKLEILLFSRFVYRGPKVVFADVGDAIDVKRFIANAPNASKRQLTQQLNHRLQRDIEALLDLPVNSGLSLEQSARRPVPPGP
jgi:1-acyl-sn-glycerol-3-phosphate acyltransferase